jgi:hypothetical protein
MTVAVMFRGLTRLTASPTEGLRAEAPAPGEATAALAEQSPDEIDPLTSVDDDRPGARLMVAEAATRVLLHPVEGPLAGCEFRLFRYDPDRERLLAVIDPARRDPDTSEGWAVGQGVTGEAWRTRTYVLATGSECWDSTFGLTPEQQERYRHLTAVAAAPVTNAAGSLIAVLSGSTSDPDSGLSSPEGFDAHLVLAAGAARILVDLLKWEADE